LPDGSQFGQFSITTPFGDTTFRFVQREGRAAPFPGFKPHPKWKGGTNRFQFSHVDSITSNFPTIQPVVLWLQEVLGFRKYWSVAFHTKDNAQSQHQGSGVKSIVMWDPLSKLKFALNEPARPNFRDSQINLFYEANRGSGVQHIALACANIQTTVRMLRTNGVSFMDTPDNYYEALPARLEQTGIGKIEEPIETLRELGLLVDGESQDAYMLQIFLKEQAEQYHDVQAGPFFLEIIQRRGDRGFGVGNFRALFESIEREKSPGLRRR
jgi:4-hydroxyphenylpyruvate dioxygenase